MTHDPSGHTDDPNAKQHSANSTSYQRAFYRSHPKLCIANSTGRSRLYVVGDNYLTSNVPTFPGSNGYLHGDRDCACRCRYRYCFKQAIIVAWIHQQPN